MYDIFAFYIGSVFFIIFIDIDSIYNERHIDSIYNESG